MAEQTVVAHLLEGYAATGENYVFEQVNFPSAYKGVMLSEWRLTQPYDPVGPKERRHFFRCCFNNPFFERVMRFLARRPFERIYLWALNQYFSHWIRHHDAKVIHAHFGMMGAKALPVARSLGLPMVVTFYGVDGSQAIRDAYWKPRIAEMLSVADKIVVLCDEVADRLKLLGCDPKKIVIWDIGIPVNEYPYHAPRYIADAEPVKFLIVARFVEKKGYRYLLQAFRKLVVEHSVQAHLTIVGNGPLKTSVLQWIEELNLGCHVDLIDTQGMSDFFNLFKNLLSEHDIFVLPSVIATNGDDEGGPPVVIANAQASGLPVISTPVGGITRAIIDGETGVLVLPENVDSLCEAMWTLSKNHGLRERISFSARQHVERNFNLELQLSRVTAIYDDLLG